MDATAPPDLDRFSDVITRRLGLQFEAAKLGFLDEVLHRRLGALKLSRAGYLGMLEAEACGDELAALASELTVGETYFFRNNEQFRALAEIVLPNRMKVQAATKALNILSAACASGEEAYSIAMVARETVADPSWRVAIRAVDLNPVVLEKAAAARYSPWALRETSPEVRRKWFRSDGRDLMLDRALLSEVNFERRNLAVDDADLWAPETYDVVFCRNVLMYFSPEQARAVIGRITRALAPGGYLFLGHAETLRGLSDDFHLRHSHEAFYYQRKAQIEPPTVGPVPVVARLESGGAAPEPLNEAWVDLIREASERVGALVPGGKRATRSPSGARRRRDLGPALDLLHRERFTEALAWVREAPAQPGEDPDALLLEAMLLAHAGQCAEAETVCRRLLAIDGLNAGAHYALALCRESVGDLEGAAEHDRLAVYLDAGFAMPRLHLGLLAGRGGDRSAARRELGQALVLLKREDASRILLFGGGFNREALMVVCQSALRACGGQP